MKTSLPIRSALCLLAMIPMWGEAKQPSKRPLIQKSPDYAAWSIVMSGRDRADATGSAQPSPPSLTAPQTTVDGDDPVVKWNFKKTKERHPCGMCYKERQEWRGLDYRWDAGRANAGSNLLAC